MVQIILGFFFVMFLIFLSFGVELKDAAKYTLVLMLVIGGIVFWWAEEGYKDHFVFAVKLILFFVAIFVFWLFLNIR